MKHNIFETLIPTQIHFAESSQEEEAFHQNDLIQLYPYGISINSTIGRPFLLLKDSSHIHTLPVAMNPLEAGVTLTQSNKNIAPLTPHKFTEQLLLALKIQIKQCVFVEIKGGNQFVRLFLSGEPKVKSLKSRAEDVMSLCLHLGVPIYATKSIIEKSKILTADIEAASQEMALNPTLLGRDHKYIM